MKRPFQTLAMMALVLPVFYFGTAGSAQAFCVYNKTDMSVHVEQVHGGTPSHVTRFKVDIDPGAKACCNWQTKDCNTKGTKNAKVKFNVYITGGLYEERSATLICKNYEIDANGRIVVHKHEHTSSKFADAFICKKE